MSWNDYREAPSSITITMPMRYAACMNLSWLDVHKIETEAFSKPWISQKGLLICFAIWIEFIDIRKFPQTHGTGRKVVDQNDGKWRPYYRS